MRSAGDLLEPGVFAVARRPRVRPLLLAEPRSRLGRAASRAGLLARRRRRRAARCGGAGEEHRRRDRGRRRRAGGLAREGTAARRRRLRPDWSVPFSEAAAAETSAQRRGEKEDQFGRAVVSHFSANFDLGNDSVAACSLRGLFGAVVRRRTGRHHSQTARALVESGHVQTSCTYRCK